MNNQNLVQNQPTSCEVEPKVCPTNEPKELVFDREKIREELKKSKLKRIPKISYKVLP
jgi:hypothetical protein